MAILVLPAVVERDHDGAIREGAAPLERIDERGERDDVVSAVRRGTCIWATNTESSTSSTRCSAVCPGWCGITLW